MNIEDGWTNKNKKEGSMINQPIGESLGFTNEIVCEYEHFKITISYILHLFFISYLTLLSVRNLDLSLRKGRA